MALGFIPPTALQKAAGPHQSEDPVVGWYGGRLVEMPEPVLKAAVDYDALASGVLEAMVDDRVEATGESRPAAYLQVLSTPAASDIYTMAEAHRARLLANDSASA